MAITSTLTTSFKKELLQGVHNFNKASSPDTFKLALYSSSASLDAATDGYTTSNEVSGSGYSAGGNALASKAVTENSTSGVFDAADPEWTSATFTARGALIYNKTLYDSDNSRGAIAVLDFGGDFTVSGGTFKIVFPAATASNAIVRID